jgi:hypothetical protein
MEYGLEKPTVWANSVRGVLAIFAFSRRFPYHTEKEQSQ